VQLARWPLILWMAALLSAAVPGIAHAQATPHIGADLFVETRAPAPGQPVRIAFRMEPERGWHGYWINPGDSGLPASVEWEAPAGVRFTQLRHPAPTLLDILGIASYVHEGPFSLLATMTVPAGLAPGTILPITAKLSWLACSDSLCVPESASLAATLQVGEGAPDAEGARIVRQAAAALPAPVPGATHARRDGQWVIDIPGPLRIDPARARLYPAGDGWFGAGAAQTIERTSGGLRVRVAPLGAAPADVFSGVISDGRSAYSIRTGTAPGGPDASGEASQAPSSATAAEPPAIAASPARAAAEAPSAMASPASAETSGLLLTAVVGAVLGGLLLNLMPCVFPILSLKALSLARSGADRAEARLEGLGYAGGSIFTATLLGGILIALKAAGQEVGWSFQLQSPAMVLILFLLTSVIALNLAGLFEFRFPAVANGSARGGWAGGFATGALAALIATPCSGPFMAGALGAALVLPAVAALAVFAGLGLGMALPFLAITWIPGLQNRMPKPGPWMAGIRRILALPMLATALALAWVLGRQTGVDGMAVGMAMAVVIGAAFWWYGHRQRIGVRAWPVLAPAVAAIGIVLAVGLPAPEPAAAAARDALHQPFSRARLAELRAAGTPVFVDFTADWCLTCKVNEKVAIETGAVQSAFREAGVVTLTGDWTRGDPEITRFLAEHGRNSIPYYLFFAPRQAGRELPQILTPALLEEMAAGGRGAREARS
jgi:thiol:disulfide interchange protein/DsbC/DsbD-like thiol-disulfide interchange protein